MALTFTTTDAAGDNINVLVYGRLGVGKTELVASCPKPILISSEGGEVTLKKHKLNIPVLKVTNVDELNEAYDFVNKNKHKYKTVCLDSVTDIAEATLNKLQKELNFDGRRVYPQVEAEMSSILRKFRDIELNSFIIANSVQYENETGMTAVRASMPGKNLTRFLGHAFDVVMYLNINEENEKNKYRYLQTYLSATVDAKDRTGNLDKFEKPNMKRIFKKLRQ